MTIFSWNQWLEIHSLPDNEGQQAVISPDTLRETFYCEKQKHIIDIILFLKTVCCLNYRIIGVNVKIAIRL